MTTTSTSARQSSDSTYVVVFYNPLILSLGTGYARKWCILHVRLLIKKILRLLTTTLACPPLADTAYREGSASPRSPSAFSVSIANICRSGPRHPRSLEKRDGGVPLPSPSVSIFEWQRAFHDHIITRSLEMWDGESAEHEKTPTLVSFHAWRLSYTSWCNRQSLFTWRGRNTTPLPLTHRQRRQQGGCKRCAHMSSFYFYLYWLVIPNRAHIHLIRTVGHWQESLLSSSGCACFATRRNVWSRKSRIVNY